MDEPKRTKNAEYARTHWKLVRQNRFDCQDCGKSVNNQTLWNHKKSQRHRRAVETNGVEICRAIALEGRKQYKRDL